MNNGLIRSLSPARVALLGLVLWMLIYLVTPSEVKVSLGRGVYLLIATIVAFFLGIFAFQLVVKIVTPKDSFRYTTHHNTASLKRFYCASIAVALIASVLRIYDKFMVRGVSLAQSVLENREAAEEGSGSTVAIVAALLTGTIFVPLFLKECYAIKVNTSWTVVSYLIFFSPVLDLIAGGSRSLLLVLIIIFIYIKVISGVIRISKTKLLILLVLGNIVVLLFGIIFLSRTEEVLGDRTVKYLVSGDANFMYTISPPREHVISILNTQSPTLQKIRTVYLTTAYYYIHSVFEYLYLIENFSQRQFQYGSYTFFVIPKMFSKIGLLHFSMDELRRSTVRPGVYTTFMGPIFIDYGWYSPLFMFIFGVVVSAIHRNARREKPIALLAYSYIIIILFFLPVFNFISGASGSYLLVSFVISFLLSKLFGL